MNFPKESKMDALEHRLHALQIQKRMKAERAAERKPPPPVRRCACGCKLNSLNDTDKCAPCRARAVRMGKPGRSPSD